MAGTEFFVNNYLLPLETNIKTIVIALDIDRWAFTDESFKSIYNSVPGFIYDEQHDFWKNGAPAMMRKIVLDNISPDPHEYGIYAYNRGEYQSEESGLDNNPEVNFMNYDKEKADFNKKKLLSIIEAAKSYGANVVGVIFPQSPLYITANDIWGRYGPSLDDAAALLDYLDSLAEAKSNFYILDEYKNGQNDYKSSDFANEDHLGLDGADKLTKRLDSLLLQIQ